MFSSESQVMFRNRRDNLKDKETHLYNIFACERTYMTGFGPYGESTEGFNNLLESGERVKFVISSKGMFIGRSDISHAYIASFQQVLTAGYVRYIEDDTSSTKQIAPSLELDNQTGHYRTTVDSLSKAVQYFESMGYNVSVVKNWVTDKPVNLS